VSIDRRTWCASVTERERSRLVPDPHTSNDIVPGCEKFAKN
jgi:hypothetical protein